MMAEQHPSGIIAFMACVRCAEENGPFRIQAGLINPYTLRLWCRRHDLLIADFTLMTPLVPRCDVCDEEILGPGHTH